MNVIFLDIDGVIITHKYRCMRPDEACVEQLNAITKKTKAMIVVSSCWRLGRTLIELRELLHSWGIAGVILDRTANPAPHADVRFRFGLPRGPNVAMCRHT